MISCDASPILRFSRPVSVSIYNCARRTVFRSFGSATVQTSPRVLIRLFLLVINLTLALPAKSSVTSAVTTTHFHRYYKCDQSPCPRPVRIIVTTVAPIRKCMPTLTPASILLRPFTEIDTRVPGKCGMYLGYLPTSSPPPTMIRMHDGFLPRNRNPRSLVKCLPWPSPRP